MKTELSPLCETMTPPGRTGRIASILCRTAVTSLSLLTLCLHGQVQSARALPPGQPIHIAALLPTNFGRFPFAIQNVKPAVDIAVKNVTGSGGRLEGREIRIHFRDSECSSAAAMNQMFEYYINKQVHVFFGPCCDYAAAPVGRQMHYWKLPMITAGAIARDFALSKSSLYDLMTRVGASVNSLVDFLLEIMREFGWSRIKQVYDPYGQSIVGDKVCHIISDGIHYGLQDQTVVPHLVQDYEKFESVEEILDKLAVEIGDWAGR
ncbi:hypothetical protein C0Q70_15188 [Pomacea canaliculata]|uniref:Receptor ligand binding region domain-containing protein n=1 Tax=Pomacea canaliculata TaxID=400727 RepID=A0A2T7NU70_POMCA|nr:hypothetical protein C0Q70_15188 [Pomacea canaliculata]